MTKIEPNHWVVVSRTYPKAGPFYVELRLESGKGYKKKKDAIKEGIRIRNNACLFLNWPSDEEDDSSCDEWDTSEFMEPLNYDDDETQTISIIRYCEYLKHSRKSSEA